MVEWPHMDEKAIDEALTRIAYEILENNKDSENLAFIGIGDNGKYLADRIAGYIREQEDVDEQGGINISVDRYHKPLMPTFDFKRSNIILVTDILYTGQTVLDASCEINNYGKPASVETAVLVERKEEGKIWKSIKPAYIGTTISTDIQDYIHVRLKEMDGIKADEVILEKRL